LELKEELVVTKRTKSPLKINKQMLRDYYKFAEEPFGVTPDPRFLYFGAQHREALASLFYGTESNRGFLALIAKPGMGKTSLLYQYLENLRGKARTAFVFRTDCDSREFIRHVLLDLGIDAAGKDLPAMHEALNQILIEEMRAGRRFVLVIDEAQNLEEEVLESIRLLSNFETPWTKLMQIVLAGQPGLAEKLSRPSMTQLRQRISLVIRVAPLNREEIDAYIDHRLSVAGCENLELFTAEARSVIAEHSEGIPRKINNICFNAMSLACALKRKAVDRDAVFEALADLDLEPLIENPSSLTGCNKERPLHSIFTPQLYTERKREWFQGWAVKVAAGVALVSAVVTGVDKYELRSANNKSPGMMNSAVVARLPVPAQSPINLQVTEPPLEHAPRPVQISEGQTLSRISVENLGRYDQQILEELRNLNPRLSDPNHIQTGQRILIPSVPVVPPDPRNLATQGFSSSLQEVGKE
jgi:general secretion pathway protein A